MTVSPPQNLWSCHCPQVRAVMPSESLWNCPCLNWVLKWKWHKPLTTLLHSRTECLPGQQTDQTHHRLHLSSTSCLLVHVHLTIHSANHCVVHLCLFTQYNGTWCKWPFWRGPKNMAILDRGGCSSLPLCSILNFFLLTVCADYYFGIRSTCVTAVCVCVMCSFSQSECHI